MLLGGCDGGVRGGEHGKLSGLGVSLAFCLFYSKE